MIIEINNKIKTQSTWIDIWKNKVF